MKLRLFTGVALAASLALALVGEFATQPALAQQSQPTRPDRGPGRGPGGPGGRDGGSIEGSMKLANRSLKTLSNQLTDASKRDENLKLICDAQRGIASAKALPLPDDVLRRAKDDAARTAWATDYRRDLQKVLRLLLDIESDIDDGKLDAAKTKLDQVQKLREADHKKMGVKDD